MARAHRARDDADARSGCSRRVDRVVAAAECWRELEERRVGVHECQALLQLAAPVLPSEGLAARRLQAQAVHFDRSCAHLVPEHWAGIRCGGWLHDTFILGP